jgi:hypothetical protein
MVQLFFLGGLFFSAALEANRPECRFPLLRLNELAPGGFLILPAKSERFLLGSLIRVGKGKDARYYLGLTGGGGSFEDIRAAFEREVRKESLGPYVREWQGEMHWKNPSDRPHSGLLLEASESRVPPLDSRRAANEGQHESEVDDNNVRFLFKMFGEHTSVMDERRAQEKKEKGKVKRREKFLQLLSPEARGFTWDQMAEFGRSHLLEEQDLLAKAVKNLEAGDWLPPGTDVRQVVINNVGGFLNSPAWKGFSNGLREGEDLKAAAELEKLLSYNLGRESLQLYMKWLEYDGFQSEELQVLKKALSHSTAMPLTVDQWMRIASVREELNTSFLEFTDPAKRTAHVQIFRLNHRPPRH